MSFAATALTPGSTWFYRLVANTGAGTVKGDTLQFSTLTTIFDVDGNGHVDALTDSLMIIRYLFGLRGPALIAGAIGSGATRTTATQIEAYIGSLMP